MPVPDPIPGVPIGLEYLAMVDTVMVFQVGDLPKNNWNECQGGISKAM